MHTRLTPRVLNYIILIVQYVNSLTYAPVVRTSLGPVRGVFEQSDDGDFFLYMGIPYAKVPDGNYFGDPVDATPWNETLEANDDSRICPQKHDFTHQYVGDMDCLNLNVYTPAKARDQPFSVLVWLYGGEFKKGFHGRFMWGPEWLVAHEIILVTISHRSGVFGLSCLDIQEVPGNAGLKDIIFGLRWVKENIGVFGGDPNDVTLGGNSSGSFEVEFILTSPMANGLIHKAIISSGSISYTRRNTSDSKDKFREIALQNGYSGNFTIHNALKYLQKLPPLDIVKASDELMHNFYFCAEKSFPSVEPFNTVPLPTLVSRQNHTPISILMGVTNKEMSRFLFFSDVDESYAHYFSDHFLGFDIRNPEDKKYFHNVVRKFYIGDDLISNRTKAALMNLGNDYCINYPMYRSARFHSQRKPVYFYMFSYDGGRNFFKVKDELKEIPGAIHADEISYLFRMKDFWMNKGLSEKFDGEDELMKQRMTKIYTNFVKFGDPTPVTDDILPVKWPPLNDTEFHFLNIDSTLSLEKSFLHDRMAFWDLLYRNFIEK